MSRIAADGPVVSHTHHVLFASPGISVADFRCRAHSDSAGPEEPNPTHSIVFVRRGVFRRTERGQTLVADPNHILFFNAGQPYSYSHPVQGGDDCTILAVATPLALELVDRYAPRDAERAETPFRLGGGLTSRRVAQLHYELLAMLRRPTHELSLEDVLAELADEAVFAAYSKRESWAEHESVSTNALRKRRDLVEAAKLAINEQLDAPPSLLELARTLGCSPFHLSRTFHRTAGLSLRRYLSRLRVCIAADRLACGAPDLTELALDLGYTDHSHFTNTFRQEWGVPPSQFRVRHRG